MDVFEVLRIPPLFSIALVSGCLLCLALEKRAHAPGEPFEKKFLTPALVAFIGGLLSGAASQSDVLAMMTWWELLPAGLFIGFTYTYVAKFVRAAVNDALEADDGPAPPGLFAPPQGGGRP